LLWTCILLGWILYAYSRTFCTFTTVQHVPRTAQGAQERDLVTIPR
jgi:hypothetical protein